MKTLSSILILSALMVLGGCAHEKGHHKGHHKGGHGDHHKKAMKDWKKMDKNSDGKVSKEEFIAVKTEKFSEMDANSDGSLTPEEMMTWKKNKHMKKE